MHGIRGPPFQNQGMKNMSPHRHNINIRNNLDEEEGTKSEIEGSNNDQHSELSVMSSSLRSPQQYQQKRKQFSTLDISSSIVSPTGSRHDVIYPPQLPKDDEGNNSFKKSNAFHSKLESTSQYVRSKVQLLQRNYNNGNADERTVTENGFFTDELKGTKSNFLLNSTIHSYYEKFDFAILLSPDEDYAYWANALDFYPETTGRESDVDNVGSPTNILDNIHNDGQCAFHPSIFERAFEEEVEEDENAMSPIDSKRVDESLAPYDDINGFHTPNRRSTLATLQSTRRRMTEALLRRGSNGGLLSPNSATPKRLLQQVDVNIQRTPNNHTREETTPFKTAGSASKHLPRGIAARAKLGELEIFLQAMSHGFVVKRHRPKAPSTFVKLFSEDGGDTIQYCIVSEEEAIIALNEQRIRYNQNHRYDIDQFRCKDSCHDHKEPFLHINRRHIPSDLPDHLFAEKYREEVSQSKGSLLQSIKSTLQKNWDKFESSGSIKAADIIDVHPSKKLDPFFTRHPSKQVQGTVSLRGSPDDYCPCNTFSIVTPSLILTKGKNTVAASDEFICQKWYSGRGNPNSFNYINFETATEGEFWVILRGFLRLHRDAASNRFAAERACGIGSHFARITKEQQVEGSNTREKGNKIPVSHNSRLVVDTPNNTEGRSSKATSSIRKRNKEVLNKDIESNNFKSSNSSYSDDDNDDVDEINDKDSTLSSHLLLAKQMMKINASILVQKATSAIAKSKTIHNDSTLDLALKHPPPPSDYFLGFKSPGTQVSSQFVHGIRLLVIDVTFQF